MELTADGYPITSSLIENPVVQWYNDAVALMKAYEDKARLFLKEKIDHEILTKFSESLDIPAPEPIVHESFETPLPLYHETPKIKKTEIVDPTGGFLPPGIPESILPPYPSHTLSAEERTELQTLHDAYKQSPARDRLLEEMRRARHLLKELSTNEEAGWELTRECSTAKTYWRAEEGGNLHSFKVVGIANVPLMDLFPIIYEAEQYPHWFPFMSKTKELFALSRFHKIIHSEVSCPWPLSNRDLVLEATGIDDTARGRVVINIRDVLPGNPHYLPEQSKLVRANMCIGGYMLQLISPTCTKISFYCNVDAKLFMPTGLLNFVTGKLIHMVISSMEGMAKKVNSPKSPFPALKVLHHEIYTDVERIVEECFGNKNDGGDTSTDTQKEGETNDADTDKKETSTSVSTPAPEEEKTAA